MRFGMALFALVLFMIPASASADSWLCTPVVHWQLSLESEPYKFKNVMAPPFLIREVEPGSFTKQFCGDGRCTGEVYDLLGGRIDDDHENLVFHDWTGTTTIPGDGKYSRTGSSGRLTDVYFGTCIRQLSKQTPVAQLPAE